jgi:hypothetical protein
MDLVLAKDEMPIYDKKNKTGLSISLKILSLFKKPAIMEIIQIAAIKISSELIFCLIFRKET